MNLSECKVWASTVLDEIKVSKFKKLPTNLYIRKFFNVSSMKDTLGKYIKQCKQNLILKMLYLSRYSIKTQRKIDKLDILICIK